MIFSYKISGLPVVQDDKLLGIITTTDILKVILGFPALERISRPKRDHRDAQPKLTVGLSELQVIDEGQSFLVVPMEIYDVWHSIFIFCPLVLGSSQRTMPHSLARSSTGELCTLNIAPLATAPLRRVIVR
jgi:hypothetical protein